MIPDRPDAPELLRIAAKVLRDDILPSAHKKLRLEGLMVLRAMAIAEREIEHGAAAALESQKALAGYYREPLREGDPMQSVILSILLANDIRAGRCDGEDVAAKVHRMLVEDVERRLAVCNPGFLDRRT